MKIEIAERLRPFSHVPGARCIIPKTSWEIEAFPTLLRLGRGKIELRLDLTGPVAGFTLQQDLELDCIWIFGQAKEGYYRLKLSAEDNGFVLFVDRCPSSGLGTSQGRLVKKQHLHLPAEVSIGRARPVERLSLGNHKNQDIEKMVARSDLKEILPHLFLLGQKVPFSAPQPLKGTARLLVLPEARAELEKGLLSFFKAAFSNFLVPRLNDDQHQGLCLEEDVQGDPCFLLQEGAKKLRELFFEQNERRLSFLPRLPISFDAGRLIHVHADGVGTLSFEWSKKLLRRVVIQASCSGDVVLRLQKELKSFRVRASLKERGKRVGVEEPLALIEGKVVLLDRFQK